jgi:DNA-binding NtrC family response regulator
VRELQNLAERLVITAASDTIEVSDLPPQVLQAAGVGVGAVTHWESTLRKKLERVERELLKDALVRYKTQALAAKHLGVTQSTVARKAKLYGLASESRAY